MVQELSRNEISLPLPIWESPYAELYLEAPGFRRYVIWKHVPGEEGARQYNRFDNNDPLPHHYYSSDEEHDLARQKYLYGGSPDKLIDVTYFPSWEKVAEKGNVRDILVFDADQDGRGDLSEAIAA